MSCCYKFIVSKPQKRITPHEDTTAESPLLLLDRLKLELNRAVSSLSSSSSELLLVPAAGIARSWTSSRGEALSFSRPSFPCRSSTHLSTFSQPLGTLHLARSLSLAVFHSTSLTSRKTSSSASIAQMTSRCSYAGIFFWWTRRACGSRPRSKRRRILSPSTRLSRPQTQRAKGGDCALYQAVEPLG